MTPGKNTFYKFTNENCHAFSFILKCKQWVSSSPGISIPPVRGRLHNVKHSSHCWVHFSEHYRAPKSVVSKNLFIYLFIYSFVQTYALIGAIGKENIETQLPDIGQVSMWRQERSPGDSTCYTSHYWLTTLPDNKTEVFPVCKESTTADAACVSSMVNNNNKREWVPSNFFTIDGTEIHGSCSCAP